MGSTALSLDARAYAVAASNLVGKLLSDYHWFELDTLGQYEQVIFGKGDVHFMPIKDQEHCTSSYGAMCAFLLDRGFVVNGLTRAAHEWTLSCAHSEPVGKSGSIPS